MTPAVGEIVTFSGSVFSGTPPIDYAWGFGDGSSGAGQTVTHTYAATGTYAVVLTATNACGSEVASDTVTVVLTPTCTPVEIVNISTVISGCVVDLGAELLGDTPYTYLWDFGDGVTSTLAMPNHDYGASGTYSGTLEVWNCENAGYDSEPFVVTVSCEPPPLFRIYLPLITRNAVP
jgi:PKD repeat protein